MKLGNLSFPLAVMAALALCFCMMTPASACDQYQQQQNILYLISAPPVLYSMPVSACAQAYSAQAYSDCGQQQLRVRVRREAVVNYEQPVRKAVILQQRDYYGGVAAFSQPANVNVDVRERRGLLGRRSDVTVNASGPASVRVRSRR